MTNLIIFLGALSIACAQHFIEPILSQSQLAGQNGQYAYDYQSGIERKTESRNQDGSTQGEYMYLDDAGVVQYVKYRAGVDGFQVLASNLPVGIRDTPEVLAARAQHEAAVQHAFSLAPAQPDSHAFPTHQVSRTFPTHHQPIHTHLGFHHQANHIHGQVPEDTPEVRAAKAQHFAAHSSHSSIHSAVPAFPQNPTPTHHFGHQPIHRGFTQFAEEIPRSALGETPEVAAARQEHLDNYARVRATLPELDDTTTNSLFHSHHAAAFVNSRGLNQGFGSPVQPLNQLNPSQLSTFDTPEVQAARAQHFAAHAAARGFGAF